MQRVIDVLQHSFRLKKCWMLFYKRNGWKLRHGRTSKREIKQTVIYLTMPSPFLFLGSKGSSQGGYISFLVGLQITLIKILFMM